MTQQAAEGRRPVGNMGKPPSLLTRYGSQMGIIGVGLAMWLAFVIAAPRVFTDIDIYRAFAETTPQFGIIALVVDLRRHHRRDRPVISFGDGAGHCGVLPDHRLRRRAVVDRRAGRVSRRESACGLLNGFLVASLNIPSLVITIGTQFLFRGLELVLMNGSGVPLVARTNSPRCTRCCASRCLALPTQTLWMVAILIVEWFLLNRTQFGAHVFLVGDNQVSARLMGVNAGRVKIKAFVLVGVTAVFVGMMSSIYGYYFWPSTGDGSLLNTIASVFLGGTSVFGGTGSVVGTFVASFIIGAINAGIVSAGINAFYTQLAFGLVIVISVVLQTLIDRRIRRQSLSGK